MSRIKYKLKEAAAEAAEEEVEVTLSLEVLASGEVVVVGEIAKGVPLDLLVFYPDGHYRRRGGLGGSVWKTDHMGRIIEAVDF